jgi:hypothetical protein
METFAGKGKANLDESFPDKEKIGEVGPGLV